MFLKKTFIKAIDMQTYITLTYTPPTIICDWAARPQMAQTISGSYCIFILHTTME